VESYEWMVVYTPQTGWIDGKGILVWIAEVTGGLGGGLYLVSLYFDSLWGMFLGWLIIISKCGFHFAHLGQPSKFWRLALNAKTSWLTRGFIFLTLFIVFGALQLAFTYWLPGTAAEITFKVLAGIMAFLVATYAGFVMNYVNGIPLWNSALLPLLFIVSGLLGGLAVIVAISLFGSGVDLMTSVGSLPLLLIINSLLIAIYLWSGTYMGPTGKRSVIELVKGRLSPVLWVGVTLCGIIFPLSISLYSYFIGEASAPFLIMAVACVIVGIFSLNYCLLKGGLYSPLVPMS